MERSIRLGKKGRNRSAILIAMGGAGIQTQRVLEQADWEPYLGTP